MSTARSGFYEKYLNEADYQKLIKKLNDQNIAMNYPKLKERLEKHKNRQMDNALKYFNSDDA